jgi:hypothetical protein
VDRTTNAGLAFFGKLLLLVGLTSAVFFHAQIPPDADKINHDMVYWQGGRILETCEDSQVTSVVFTIPPWITLAPIVLGSLFLIMSRRHDGPMHFFRGFMGCLIGVIAAIVALGPADQALSAFLGSNWEDLDEDNIPLLVATGLPLILSMALLFWPKRQQVQQIVV